MGSYYNKNPSIAQFLAETITNVDYVNNLGFLATTPAQAESLLHSLEQAARGIGFFNNMCSWVLIKMVSSSHLMASLWNH